MGFFGNLKNKIEGPAITATPDEVFDFLTNEGLQSLQSAESHPGAVGFLVSTVADNVREINIKNSDSNNKTIRYSYKAGPDLFSDEIEVKIVSANDHQASHLSFTGRGGNTNNGAESPYQKLESRIRTMAGQRFGTTPFLHADKDNNELM